VIDRNQVHRGMVVRSSDGKKLGHVAACEERSFVVEKGFFFATDYIAGYDDVTDISEDEIQLSRTQEELAHGEHAFTREGGLGESLTLGVGSGLDASGESWPRREEVSPRYRVGEHGDTLPASYGDEGGGGLL
jgi:hypothetical protein